MACLYEAIDVGFHEWLGHGDLGTIRQHEFRVVLVLLDEGEDVVPPAAVEAS